ncbi:MAG: galactokinase, partial [Bacteroidota bacterium]
MAYDTADIARQYQNAYGIPELLLRSPARINLIGEHTDYNNGFVLPAAIDRDIYFAMGMRADGHWSLEAMDIGEKAELTSAPTLPNALWAQYFFAIREELSSRKLPVKGINCAFGGNIPRGAGISSSAALTCGFIYGLDQLHHWGLTRLDIARIAQAAEHRVGIKCGIMDQYAVLHGREQQAIQLDCRSLTHTYASVDTGDFRFVLFNSMVSHSLASTAYNDRREACESVVAAIRQQHPEVESVRDISPAQLEEQRHQLPAIDLQRVSFVMQENERVRTASQALQAGQLDRFGQLMFQSHEGLSKEYEVSCIELDFLVDFMRQFPEQVWGARMMGGGFGGCTLNLIHKDAI